MSTVYNLLEKSPFTIPGLYWKWTLR